MDKMIYEVELNAEYLSRSGYRCKVLALGRHGQDCSIGMVAYTNLVPTFDSPAGQLWFITESLFLSRFRMP